MAKKAPIFSRRQAAGLLFLAPALPFLPASASASGNHEWQMRRSLAGIQLPVRPASLDLVTFSQERRNGRSRMSAVVRMTWPPGMRQRRFTAERGDADQALADLLEEIGARFSSVA